MKRERGSFAYVRVYSSLMLKYARGSWKSYSIRPDMPDVSPGRDE